MTEMSRGDVIRRLDGASKDFLKRLANGPLGDGRPHGLEGDSGATTSIVAHLGGPEIDEPREDA
jgi:hypothetical protein